MELLEALKIVYTYAIEKHLELKFKKNQIARSTYYRALENQKRFLKDLFNMIEEVKKGE